MSFPAPGTVADAAWQAALAAGNGNPVAAACELIEKGILNYADWCRQRAAWLGWDYEPAPDLGRVDRELARRFSFGQLRRFGVIPAYADGGVTVVWAKPDIAWDCFLELQAEFCSGIRLVVIPEDAFIQALQRIFERSGTAADMVQELDDSLDLRTASSGLPDLVDLLDSQDDAPIIRFINAVLAQAIEQRASDVHIEPFESRVMVRYRVDGILRDVVEPPAVLAGRIAARVKVMARLDIAEKRTPQDGRISLRLAGRTVDVRVSTLPTHYGERVVMRILEKEKGPLELAHIGMPLDVQARFADLILSPYGILLVTGPTGSGKTTTLYTALQQVRSPGVNIITVEDPVEYDLEGVGQIPVNQKTGMTFERGLRAILRQDPDVVMVGEIRDIETAKVAVQASLTGHRVFSTLHTNDAIGSVTRLVDMGIEPYLAASCLLGTIAQRLVRKLCPDCREAHRPDPGERQLLKIARDTDVTIYLPRGCTGCAYTGYRGRTGIFELLVIDEEIRQLIHDNRGEQVLRKAARKNGMRALRDDGMSKVLQGVTSMEEVLRVTLN